jgi:hypothetical protein
MKWAGHLKRPGIDHDAVKPGNLGTLPLRSAPVEIVSLPCPVTQSVMVRMIVGDPTTLQEVPLNQIAAFAPDRI